MYAVVSDRGRQHCLNEGDTLLLDLHKDGEGTLFDAGHKIELVNVLLIGGGDNGPMLGAPTVAGAKVIVEVVENMREKKIHVGWYRRRKNFRKHKGHRQQMTRVIVRQIVSP